MALLTVNHSGTYKHYRYQMRVPFEIEDADVDDVMAALGDAVLKVDRTPKAEKEAKPTNDKMVRKDQKVVTK
jgi:hypothetical protein